jgi:non-specific serine/threonine protein kinase
LFHLSAVAWEEDDRAAEVQYAQQMLELSRAMQDEFQYSAALQRLGVIKIEAGDIEAGLQLVVEALAVSAKLDEEYFRSIQLWSIALGRMRLGELAPAERAGREALELATALGDGHSMSLSTECLAWIAAERRDAIKAAQLLGFASEMWRSMGTGLFPPLVPYRERCERYARAALGDTTFLEEFSRGKALSQAEVIGLAAHETPGKLEASVRPWIASLSSGHPALTARELEVGRMVAAGLTNKEIGAELLISTRTVEAHVGHVLTKLSLSSRIQLANWLRNAPVGDAVGDRRNRS